MCAAMGTQYRVFARVFANLILAATTMNTIDTWVALDLGLLYGNKCVDRLDLEGTPKDHTVRSFDICS